MTLLEVVVAIMLLSIAFLMYSSTTVSVNRQREASREMAIASDAAREVMERIRSLPLEEVYPSYNRDPSDDPGGPGTAPGHRFPVEELEPIPGMPDGTIGEVQFPEMEVAAGTWELREDLLRPDMGMPRDLNGDSILDLEDHADDYVHLPVRVRLDWRGRHGPRSLKLDTMIVPYRK